VKYIVLILFLGAVGFIHGQFVLPEEKYTTQKDINVIRSETAGKQISGITVKREGSQKIGVRVSWKIVENRGELAIFRYNAPINSNLVLTDATLLGVIDGSSTSYTDNPEKSGTYYYAVLLNTEVKSGAVILVANENYSTKGYKFFSKNAHEAEPIADNNISVTNISLQKTSKNSVRVLWNYTGDNNISFNIYRSSEKMDTPEKILEKNKIGTVTQDKRSYDDLNIAAVNNVYYAISIQMNDKNIIKLVADQSYSTTPLQFSAQAVLSVSDIAIFKGANGESIITWKDAPDTMGYTYLIYRSEMMLNSTNDLQKASLIGEVASGVQKFSDNFSSEKSIYYAVVTKASSGETSSVFIQGANTLFTTVKMSQSESLFFDLKVYVRNGSVALIWKTPVNVDGKSSENRVNIYRFRKKPRSINELSLGTLVARIPETKNSFIDIPLGGGVYYYSLFMETPKGIYPNEFVVNENLIGPVVYHAEKEYVYRDHPVEGEEPDLEHSEDEADSKKNKLFYPEESTNEVKDKRTVQKEYNYGTDTEIKRILQKTYNQKKYAEAIEELSYYRDSSLENVKAAAIFYTALSNYELGNYQKALEDFLNPHVKKIYKERSEFWYKRTLEQLN